MTSRQTKPDFYLPNEVAQELGVSRPTVWRLFRSGDLPTVHASLKPGLKPRTLVRAADLEAFIKERSDVA
jgi:AcrR family transcriptional regulator